MNKIITRAAVTLVTGLLVCNTSFASHPESSEIARHCSHASGQLHHLVQNKPHDRCSGDLEIAAAYIESAELELRHEKFDKALTSIKYSQLELKEISATRTYCAHFSDSVKPVIAQVILIGSEIEVLERLAVLSKGGAMDG